MQKFLDPRVSEVIRKAVDSQVSSEWDQVSAARAKSWTGTKHPSKKQGSKYVCFNVVSIITVLPLSLYLFLSLYLIQPTITMFRIKEFRF